MLKRRLSNNLFTCQGQRNVDSKDPESKTFKGPAFLPVLQVLSTIATKVSILSGGKKKSDVIPTLRVSDSLLPSPRWASAFSRRPHFRQDLQRCRAFRMWTAGQRTSGCSTKCETVRPRPQESWPTRRPIEIASCGPIGP